MSEFLESKKNSEAGNYITVACQLWIMFSVASNCCY